VRFLGGAGGYADSSTAYLEYESAAAYLALSQRDLRLINRRTAMPLAKVAQQILVLCRVIDDSGGLAVGAGRGGNRPEIRKGACQLLC
jgi:hypothetical protein